MYAQQGFSIVKKTYNPLSALKSWFKPLPGKPTPKEAVIMHADIVNSTNLVKQDFVLAHTKVETLYARLCQIVRSCGGSALEMRGDAVIFEFPSAADSVRAGKVMQSTNFLLNSTRMGNLEPRVRIGISKGPIVMTQTVTGESIIRAQRLEQLAEPGEIIVDQSIREEIGPGHEVALESLGTETLKGFSTPTNIYRVVFECSSVKSLSRSADKQTATSRKLGMM